MEAGILLDEKSKSLPLELVNRNKRLETIVSIVDQILEPWVAAGAAEILPSIGVKELSRKLSRISIWSARDVYYSLIDSAPLFLVGSQIFTLEAVKPECLQSKNGTYQRLDHDSYFQAILNTKFKFVPLLANAEC